MNAKQSLLVLAITVVALAGAMAAFNYTVDPQCFYHCDELDVNKRTVNSYYQVAQRIIAHPETEVVILGSSRGEGTSPLWVQDVSGLKTLNLSASGAELTTKFAFLKIAEEKTKVRKVIWLADFFELIGETKDAKIKNTPALKRFLKDPSQESLMSKLDSLRGLLDHNTFEASIYFMNHQNQTEITQGAGSQIDYRACASADYKGKANQEILNKEVGLIYESYIRGVIHAPQSEEAWNEFSTEMRALAKRGVEVVIQINPYHPEFLRRLQVEHADIYSRHVEWIQKLKSLQEPGITVLDFFAGVPDGDASPKFWDDGVHFNCHSSIVMLQKTVEGWK